MNAPTVSVLVTCYNLGQFLDEAIDSVMAQTLQDFEIVIVDDGSTESATVELLAHYVRPRTRLIHTPNRGLPAARNEAARHTTGRYLCALDADDRLAPTWLEKAVRVLDADSSIAFVSHWLRAFGTEDWDWTPERCDLESLLTRNTINGAALVRREAFLSVGGFDESMTDGCEDWDLWLTMVEHGFRGTIIPEILFFYRRRHDSMSQLMLRGETHVRLFERLIRKHEASYRRHLAPLVVQKDADILGLRRELHDLRVEDETRLAPAAARAREQAAWLRAKAERARGGPVRASTPAAPGHAGEADLLRADRDRFRSTLEEVQHELDLVRGDRDGLRRDLADMTADRDRFMAALDDHTRELARVGTDRDGLRRDLQDITVERDRLRVTLAGRLDAAQAGAAHTALESANARAEGEHQRVSLDAIERARAEAEDAAGHLERQATVNERHISQLRTGYADLARHAARLEEEVAAIRASASWKVTRPLRAALGWTRRQKERP